jgi:hypothetical protein
MPALRATGLDTLALIERPHMNSHQDTGASTPEALSTSNDHCDEHRPALAHPFDDLPLNSELALAPAPRDRLSDEEVDHFPMPTPDQVARSMARALKFREVSKHQEERDCQIAEGRKMARFENQAPRQAHEHKAANRHPHPHPQQALAEGQVPAKKRRNRNRNKNKGFARCAEASPVFVAH